MARKRKPQIDKVRDFLSSGRKLTGKTAINRWGAYRLSAIIWTLRHVFNMDISTDRSKGYAIYSLNSTSSRS